MIQITPQMRILVAVEPSDFRRGIDGLARVCKEVLQRDPFSGCMFVFRNRPATALKILVYDGQGFWLCHKRLSKGKFAWWPREAQRHGPWRPTNCRSSWRPGTRKPRVRRPSGDRSDTRHSRGRRNGAPAEHADVCLADVVGAVFLANLSKLIFLISADLGMVCS